MKIEDANRIPLPEILGKIGFAACNHTPGGILYVIPQKNRIYGRFLIKVQGNTWTNLEDGSHGNAVEFVSMYLEANHFNHQEADVLQWFDNVFWTNNFFDAVPIPDEQLGKYIFKNEEPIYRPSLKRFLKNRGIPLLYADLFLRELIVKNTFTDKRIYVLGLKNDKGGWNIRNDYTSSNVGPMDFTFLRGTIHKPDGIHIFRDIYDYLSQMVARQGEPFKNDAIILNSPTCMADSLSIIRKYGYRKVYTWLANSKIGAQATAAYDEFFKTEPDLKHYPMNAVYKSFHNLNQWLLSKQKSNS